MQTRKTIGYFRLLQQNPSFRNLWYGQVVSELGDWLNSIAIYALILKLSDSGMAMAGAMMAKLLPIVLVSPIAGVVVDRVSRKNVMIISDLLRCVVVLGFLLVEDQDALWLVYALVIVEISLSGFFEPARSAIIPSLVPKSDLVTANALSGSTWSVMLAFGAALGGGVVYLFGIKIAFILDASTFLLSAWFISKIAPQEKSEKRDSPKLTGELSEAIRYLIAEPMVLVLSLLKAGLAVAGGIMTLIPLMASQLLSVSPSLGIGILYSARGLGAALGPVLVRRIFGESASVLQWAIASAFFLKALSYIFIAYSHNLWTLSLGVGLATLFGSIIWVFSSALIHLSAPDHYLGRVFSFELALLTLVMGFSNFGVGYAVDGWDMNIKQIALWMGGLVLIPGLLWSGFLVFLRNRLEQGACVGSVCPVDPSGFNPNPIAGDQPAKNQAEVK
ncbi:MAG: MFS transporter [Nitrospina sp.]|jgi:predicted MFS family arabinose efflux permease|nr:MFS transporter [Nitrospina sp.]MBT3511072.1 MFS transporter [Nitrospina sp.]MBT3875564.1 MFS transporter [Nitrospina sp.]MBT4047145.1 MFS transporter [Nitrospina sp.]MBT4557967.1 MFS transporter [Nitrospina sp.]